MAMTFNASSKTTALAALGVLAGAATPLIMPAPTMAQQVEFTDVGSNYWARPFIERLAAEDIIAGFPDGSFQPNQPVTRAQFAAIVRQAFNQPMSRSAPNFPDVAADYWAREAIANAYSQGFMSGYPDNSFKPSQEIPRVQVLVALTNGLDFNANGSINQALSMYRDGSEVPSYAEDEVATATEKGMVVNYPNIDRLQPQAIATRADVAAFIYQALVAQGRMPALDANLAANNYVVGNAPTNTNPGSALTVQAGSQIDLQYPNGNDVNIVVAPGQTIATTLEVSNPVRNSSGQVLIPAGSQVQGRIVPVNIQGASITAAKFVADTLTVNNRSYSINAESSAIAATDNVNTATLQGALVTAAAESIVGTITGQRGLGTVIGQVITGENGQATSQNAVVVIDPSQLDLVVGSDFSVASIANN